MKTLKHIFFFLFLLFTSASLFSQNSPTMEWIRLYNGGQSNTIKVDANGNVYVSGRIWTGDYSDIYTIKYNSNGDQQWVAIFNGAENLDDYPASIDVDDQGNVFITGVGNQYYLNPVFTGDYCTIKYNSAGVQQWVNVYSGNSNGRDIPFKIAVDASGNSYVTGQSYIDAQRSDDIVTIKYAPDGTQLWLAVHDGSGTNPEQDAGRDLVLDDQGNVYVFGHSTRLTTWYDLCLIKYNSTGALQFIQHFSGPYNNITEYGVALTLDSDGNIYCIGELSDSKIAVLKFSPSGTPLWNYRNGGTFSDKAKDIITDGAGNVYFCGSTGSTGFIAKLNNDGSLAWNKIITGTGGNEIVNELIMDVHGDIYLTGKVAAGTYFDCITEKVDPAGNTKWRVTYNGGGNLNDFGNAIGMDDFGNVYVTGGNNENGWNNMCTIKYAQGNIGIHSISNELPNGFSLSQNYPNPFNPTTKINFSLPIKDIISLKVFDVTGKEIANLISGMELQPGTYSYDFDASGFVSGVYFYTLQANNFSESRKMLLIK